MMPGPVGAGGRDDVTDEAVRAVTKAINADERAVEIMTDSLAGIEAWVRTVMEFSDPLIASAIEQRVRAEVVADLVSARDADQLERRREARDENLDDAESCEQPDWECHASAALSAWADAIRVAHGVSL